MRPAGLLFLVPAVACCPAPAAEPAHGLVSGTTSAHIREALPRFQPPAPAASTPEGAAPAPGTPADPNLLVLPKITVREARLPSDAADHLISPRDFKRRMENLYLDEVAAKGELNYLLNSFTIPILSPSKAERGRAIYIRRELERLQGVQSSSSK